MTIRLCSPNRLDLDLPRVYRESAIWATGDRRVVELTRLLRGRLLDFAFGFISTIITIIIQHAPDASTASELPEHTHHTVRRTAIARGDETRGAGRAWPLLLRHTRHSSPGGAPPIVRTLHRCSLSHAWCPCRHPPRPIGRNCAPPRLPVSTRSRSPLASCFCAFPLDLCLQ